MENLADALLDAGIGEIQLEASAKIALGHPRALAQQRQTIDGDLT